MKQAAVFVTLLALVLNSMNANAQKNNIQKYVDQLKKDTLFSNSVVGIMVTDQNGKTVASWNPDMPLLTASTMKTISTGLAMKVLGPDYRFKTKVGYVGEIRDGILYGDLYIVGGGDPTLGSRDTVAYPVDSIFGEWAKAISLAGISKISGNIIGDDRYFENEIVPGSWAISNLGPTFGSGPSGLSFMENQQEFRFTHSGSVGSPAVITNVYPTIPGLTIKNEVVTAPDQKGSGTDYRVTELSRTVKFSGTIPQGRDTVTITGSAKFPAVACAEEFRKYLKQRGVESNPLAYDSETYNVVPQEQIIIIGETSSPELFRIVNVTNRISNNFYAETLYKTLGKVLTGVGSYDSSRVAVTRLMSSMGLPLRGFSQIDGSGLSRQNYVSARFFCNYFAKLKEKNDNFELFFESLPQPGGPGTLQNVLSKANPVDKKRLHAKSGSLSSVRCYAGYAERKNGGMYYFAILTNNYQARTAQMQPAIEGFLHELIK